MQSTLLSRCFTAAAAFTVLTVAFGFSLLVWPAIYRPLTHVYGWKLSEANAGGAIVLLLVGLASSLTGFLVDRFGAKRVILGGIAGIAGAFTLLASAHSKESYYACCCMLGLGGAAVSIVPCSLLIGSLFRNRALVVGLINAGVGIGGLLAPRLVTGWVENGIPHAFRMLALSMAVPAAMMLAVKPEPLAQKEAVPGPRVSDLIRTGMFWVYGIALFLGAHAMLGLQQNMITFLGSEHLKPAVAASVLGLAMISASPGKIISGWIADRAGARASVLFGLACVALGIGGFLVTPAAPDRLIPAAVLFGLGYGSIFNATPSIAFENFGVHRVGGAMGLFYLFFGFGTASGGELAALGFERAGQWKLVFETDLALAVIAVLLVLTTRRLTGTQLRTAESARTAKHVSKESLKAERVGL